MTAQYVYGVTYVDTTVPGDLSGIDDAPVLAVSHDRCAALVSDLTGDRPLGTRDDLIAHERVLETLAREGRPLLPFRFGGMLPGMDEIPGELLGPNQDRFLADLDRVKDRVELVVKGTL